MERITVKPNELAPLSRRKRYRLFMTLRKGKKVKPDGILINRTYSHVIIDQSELNEYRAFFGFTDKLPLPYMYILAQRAQIPLMLDKEFSLPIPGMIHINNSLQRLDSVNLDLPLEISVKAEVKAKESGSFFPTIEVEFFQNEKLVVSNTSGYLVKRKHSKPKSKPTQKEPMKLQTLKESILREEWDLPKALGKDYAKVSGDNNPIHTSNLFAKLAGFKSPIIHGWYSVSRMAKAFSQIKSVNLDVRQIDVFFNKPILLSGSCQLEFGKIDEDTESTIIQFQITSSDKEIIHLYGSLNVN